MKIPQSLILSVTLFLAGASLVAAPPDEAQFSPRPWQQRIHDAQAEHDIDARLAALASVGQGLALDEIHDVLAIADLLPSLRQRVALRNAVIIRWGDLAPAEAFSYLIQTPESLSKVQTIKSVASAYAEVDPAAAAAAALAMSPGRAQNQAVSAVAEKWAHEDLQSAQHWAAQIPSGVLKDVAVRNIYFVWVQVDAPSASSQVLDYPLEPVRQALLMSVASNWAGADPQAALNWIDSHLQGELQVQALVIAVEAWANYDAPAAARYAAAIEDNNLRQRSVAAALERWATQDPSNAFHWAVSENTVLGIAPSPASEILRVAAPVLPVESATWVEQLEQGPLRNELTETYVNATVEWNPLAATLLAAELNDVPLRFRLVESALEVWSVFDPDSARAWLKSSDLPEDAKSAWFDAMDQGGPAGS